VSPSFLRWQLSCSKEKAANWQQVYVTTRWWLSCSKEEANQKPGQKFSVDLNPHKFKGVGTTVVISIWPSKSHRYNQQQAKDMSAHSPAPASNHSMATFLCQCYGFQKGDMWEFKVKGTTHTGTLQVNSSTVYFTHTQDTQVASTLLPPCPF
jgi:hypothetical protein